MLFNTLIAILVTTTALLIINVILYSAYTYKKWTTSNTGIAMLHNRKMQKQIGRIDLLLLLFLVTYTAMYIADYLSH
ncbi:MAG: hypothetical protein [Bacteriophage sp.]|nr:MAG: hypothetical protein [Bacteriophage sp.]